MYTKCYLYDIIICVYTNGDYIIVSRKNISVPYIIILYYKKPKMFTLKMEILNGELFLFVL